MTAERFLSILGDRHTFQTFDDSARKDRRLSRILHGTLAEHAATLAGLNARGAGVFVMVNEGDGKRRATANVKRVRSLFVDLDGEPLEPITSEPLAPHCIVESSPGRWHAYWIVADCPLDQFKSLQKAFAARFNGDAKVCDLPRVMRLPGFQHRKREPFTSRIIALDAMRASYSVADIRRAFGMPELSAPPVARSAKERRALPDVIPKGERNATLLRLGGGLVRKGHGAQAVNDRLQRINAERCTPPLGADEVDAIASRASGYGSDGFAMLPHKLLDSPEWKSLAPPARCIVVVAYRRYNGTNLGNIALTWADFEGEPGFRNAGAFYRHRAAAVRAGILIETRKGSHTQQGITPTLYAIADRFLHVSQAAQSAPSASCTIRQSYIDKQFLGAGAAEPVHKRRKPKKAA